MMLAVAANILSALAIGDAAAWVMVAITLLGMFGTIMVGVYRQGTRTARMETTLTQLAVSVGETNGDLKEVDDRVGQCEDRLLRIEVQRGSEIT
jgi:hypothetical protein